MTVQYPVCKTVRYEAATFKRIKVAAALLNVTTAEYIRDIVEKHVERIDLKQVLGDAS